MSAFTPGRARRSATIVAIALSCLAASWTASAQSIQLTGGSIVTSGPSGYGSISVAGDRGFTFAGEVISGNYQPGVCSGSPCAATDRISLYASWSGSDVPGTATLDGITYPRVGSTADTSPTSAALTVTVEGSVQLPHWGSINSLTAPVLFTATLYHQGGSDRLVGSGVATIELSPLTGYAEEYWTVTRVTYELGGRTRAPFASSDVGVTGIAGHSSELRRTVVMLGGGTDIWSTADGFRFIQAPAEGPGGVSARVSVPSRVSPSALNDGLRLNPFAKAGVMIRQSIEADAASVFLGVKPDGEIEFLVRPATGAPTLYVGGAHSAADRVWLALAQATDGTISASYSEDNEAWTVMASVRLMAPAFGRVAGLALTSHDPALLAGALFDQVTVASNPASRNLLEQGDFEGYHPSLLGLPGWQSDDLLRQVAAKSETHQPRSGVQNGACWTESALDCGLYQDVTAPASGRYTMAIYAAADRRGGMVGVNVEGQLAGSREVAPGPFGVYERYSLSFTANAGEVIRVWMYSPATPGYLVVDDASLMFDEAALP